MPDLFNANTVRTGLERSAKWSNKRTKNTDENYRGLRNGSCLMGREAWASKCLRGGRIAMNQKK